MITVPNEQPVHPQVKLARFCGQVIGGFAVGLLLIIASVELYAQFGNLTAFEYQGY